MIPPAVQHALKSPLFEAASFTPTKFHTAEDKAWFANHFLKFVSNDFPVSAFTKRFYRQLSNTFGHIAHFDRPGFFEYFFQDTRCKLEFLDQTLKWPCYGHPEFTFCDVERALATRIGKSNLLTCYETQLAAEIRDKDQALLARLKSKYEPAGSPPLPATSAFTQTDLFDLSA